MLRYAIDQGVNYIDTAYPYHGGGSLNGGRSETFLAEALRDGYQERVRIATKMPTWLVTSQKDMDKYLNRQLDKLQVETIDFYLLHGLERKSWTKLRKLDVISWLEKKIAEGKIKHLGFSFHDSFSAFERIIDDYDCWAMCQIQFNYMDANYQAGTRGLEYAASKGLAVVVMEPIAGGRLAINPPKPIQEIWAKAKVRRSQAEWALRWVWNRPEVSVALSGMSTLEQVKENVETASHSKPPTLDAQELMLIEKIAKKYRKLGFAACTGCRYCQPCPEDVSIPEIIALYNQYYARNRDKKVTTEYLATIAPGNRAKKCARCAKCEEICPQRLPIRQIIGNAALVLERGA